MINLIIIIISIGLLAAVTAATLNYVPFDAHLRQLMQTEAGQGVKSLEQAVSRYLVTHRDVDGNIEYPGDGVNMVAAVTPTYGFLPANVRKEMTWDIATGTVNGLPAVGICLRPILTSTPMQRDIIKSLQAQMPIGSTFVSTSCYASSDTAGGSYLTRWVPLAHLN